MDVLDAIMMMDLSPEEAATSLEQWREAFDCLKAAWSAYVEAVRPAYEAIKEWCATFVDTVREQYRVAGAPCGDTDEGMWRWLREQMD